MEHSIVFQQSALLFILKQITVCFRIKTKIKRYLQNYF